MTTVKVKGQLIKRVAEALQPFADRMYADRGHRWVALVELDGVERIEADTPGDDGDTHTGYTVVLRLAHVEIADGRAEDPVRQALRALWARRTADGTLDAPLAEREADTATRLLPHMVDELDDHL
ncbi:hypothetical protein [Nocardiopsis sp. HUAS JQ3]|uniref:hypothetical protein n=1 Tax=Nocardiopsis sp. HUAS JQ3 TaxID=3061629 RepID=UPI0023A963DA|nr:hypothetical protein [Nocardiopsis sp. HUAS JQ3]WDZ91165.1 hypothetical protein PV789_00885 [Nocardiopsis sp. HUAS JQ3]